MYMYIYDFALVHTRTCTGEVLMYMYLCAVNKKVRSKCHRENIFIFALLRKYMTLPFSCFNTITSNGL